MDARLDEYHLEVGEDLPHFMERELAAAEYVILVCTEDYKKKADERRGGVGWETTVVTADLYKTADRNTKTYIPIVKGSSPGICLPTYLASRFYVRFTTETYATDLESVLRRIYGRRKHRAPALGRPRITPIVMRAKSKAPKGQTAPVQPTDEEVTLRGTLKENRRFEIQMYWGSRSFASVELGEAIWGCRQDLFVAGMGATTVEPLLNDGRIIEGLAQSIRNNPKFKITVLTLDEPREIRMAEEGGEELTSRIERGQRALRRFREALAGVIGQPPIDFRCYKKHIVPRHFLLRADDVIYAGSYLSHLQGANSYLIKLQNFGDGLYRMFDAEIEYLKDNSSSIRIGTARKR